jgi:hypothetical protein
MLFSTFEDPKGDIGDHSPRNWRKSSFSWGNSNCVEVVADPAGDLIKVRDSKHPKGPILGFTPDGWDAFLAEVRNDEFGRRR